ncbi:uncharacterized protein LOC129004646 [Macrosteles quadrilineatus]|uniref:uncharacterized protein LOC129004646 n=1 Tax=Macrosteles quadrilineatus TaxID=74068 RepID=UPI0023E236A6|nr:uncharacterized protein LOC129004646 [Macrosteles quadrilineatus]
MGDYQPLRSDDGHVNASATSRNKPPVYYKKPMSPLRRAAFVFSVLLCITVITVFLWVIPCDWSKCPARAKHQPIMSWERSIEGLEIKGPLKIVRGAQGLNIVAMYKAPVQKSDLGRGYDQFPPKGLISFMGTTGIIAWFFGAPSPTHLDCLSLKINDNSLQDCLVRGSRGYLAAVDALSGIFKWRAGANKFRLVDVSFPVVTPDLNYDGYHDLAVTTRNKQNSQFIAIISGQTGSVLGKPMEVKGCTDINNLTLDRDYTLYYNCRKNNNSTGKTMSVGQIALVSAVQAMTNHTVEPRGSVSPPAKHLGNEWTVNNYRLNLQNSGSSPADYQVVISVVDHHNQSVWNPTLQQTYAMTPVILHLQHAISGFLLKFWYWHNPTEQRKDKNGYLVNTISERVVLVTFNATGSVHIVNASQTEIIQLCSNSTCQPQLVDQMDSLLIVDLDEDGSQELISYLVTYVGDDKPGTWRLQSRVRLIRLEAELPKLYEAIEGHKAQLLVSKSVNRL